MTEGRLAPNIVHFCRTLRAAGLPVGPGRTLDAVRAVARAGVRRRDDFYWTLHASLIGRHDQKTVFDQAFHAFWGMPDLLERLDGAVLPPLDPVAQTAAPGARRVSEALRPPTARDGDPTELVFDSALTASTQEVLRKRDFEQMSTTELALARRAVRALARQIAPLPTRRFRADRRGERIDPRRAFRASLRADGAIRPPARRRRMEEPPPLVVLCDLSGSMGR